MFSKSTSLNLDCWVFVILMLYFIFWLVFHKFTENIFILSFIEKGLTYFIIISKKESKQNIILKNPILNVELIKSGKLHNATVVPDDQRRKLLVLIDQVLEDIDKQFLAKITQAINLDLDQDVYIEFLPKQNYIQLSGLNTYQRVDRVLSFGLSAEQLMLKIPKLNYKPIPLQNHVFLFADQLSTIRKERESGRKEKAGKLWQGLQTLFPSPQ